MKRKNKKLIHIGNILGTVLKTQIQGSDLKLTKLWDIWEETVGQTIAQNAKVSAFKEKLLIVEVSDSTWLYQLQFLKEEMKQKINQALGKDAIEEIKFKVGDV
jgi:predicted nucleic acid-binding Zn ribbon protein